VVLMLLLAGACSGSDAPDATAPGPVTLALTLSGLPALDGPTEGRWEAWVVDRAGVTTSLGTLDLRAGGDLTVPADARDAVSVAITWEPPGDTDGTPSPHRILSGAFSGPRATLSVAGAVTQGQLPLRERPGQFTMFSPSDNDLHGYPSHEEAGIWLFNMAPRETVQNDMWVRLSQLQLGWVYEGWMVRDIDAPTAIWLSYGKFLPDASGAVNTRDDTGWGPFSGATDFLTAGEEEFPGDDWIENPLGFDVPAGLALPLNLREKNAQGTARWTHVITIEPAADRGEGTGRERPFVLRPYRDVFGDGGPGAPRAITLRPAGVPAGLAVRG
jgi:hypothetical protein